MKNRSNKICTNEIHIRRELPVIWNFLKGSFNNYVDRILTFSDTPSPLVWTVFIPWAWTKTDISRPPPPLSCPRSYWTTHYVIFSQTKKLPKWNETDNCLLDRALECFNLILATMQQNTVLNITIVSPLLFRSAKTSITILQPAITRLVQRENLKISLLAKVCNVWIVKEMMFIGLSETKN